MKVFLLASLAKEAFIVAFIRIYNLSSYKLYNIQLSSLENLEVNSSCFPRCESATPFFDEILALPKFYRKYTPHAQESFPAAKGGA
jgi:hypothetical protein